MLLIMGRAAAGKDALADALAEQGLRVEGRPCGEDGHVCETDEAEVLVASPERLDALMAESEREIHLVYVVAAEESARLTMARIANEGADDPEAATSEREGRESAVFDKLEALIQESADRREMLFGDCVRTVRVLVNDYQVPTLADMCARIQLEARVRRNVVRILSDAAFTFGDIRSDGVDKIVTMSADGNPSEHPVERVADAYVANPELLGPVMLAWLRHVEISDAEGEPIRYAEDIVIGQTGQEDE